MVVLFWMEIASLALAAVCIATFLILVYCMKRGKSAVPKIPSVAPCARFAVIVPARNESAVIEDCLRGLRDVDYPQEMYKTYVIVESMDDPTVKICESYPRTEIYLRRNYERAGKGPALDECMKYIFAGGEQFDAVMILDADNVIESNFLARLNDAYVAGYDAACGKRNNKDWNSSAVSAASGLTFMVINTLQNKSKADRGMNVMFTGTGFYIRTEILKKLNGWPFATMTEDYEFSTYALYNGISTVYIEDAIYYDEQPRGLWQSIIQRTRWVKGFFTVRIRYKKQKKQYQKSKTKNKNVAAIKYGTVPLLTAAISLVAYLFVILGGISYTAIVKNGFLWAYLVRLGAFLLAFYFGVVLFTLWLFQLEKKDIDIKPKNKVKTVFYHAIYLVTYLIAIARIPLIKNKWEVIRHTSGEERKK